MAVTTPAYASDALAEGTVDAVVIGGGAAGLNGALILARSRRSVVVIDSGSPRNAPAEAVHGLLALDGTPPSEILRRGREQVRQYGGRVVSGEVVSAESAAPSEDGDLRFTVTLADGRRMTARRVLVATGLKDVLPEVPGLAEHWGHRVVHCPYCHGWEVRDEPIGILATGPASIGHAYLFRQLTEDLTYFTHTTDLDQDSRARFAARGIRIIDTPVTEVVDDEDGALAGVRLADGQVVARRVLAVAAPVQARTKGLEGLGLPVQELPGKGRGFASGLAGSTEVPGVWVAGNVTDLVAQVGASAAAGALAGADINRMLAIADTDAALQKTAEASPQGATG
ncbi:NAD(P)/FAD-dependent oxidoreductase [Streptomyces sp. S3(2020)]|uniref:NAD(P)/FAD-dependent oxidoreductase n=1 Tax=Streptomyces sp. S3(2020) TaxID=2732044 RepID=UPI001489F737|nr:NAD(P)/FAD-dependent oxidoreductase [Streptomyces sp. S3(2020)]NNN33425.1 NAD(P)/FAD-dependent oxidoreductase [Streptomyces sp. S3(2020)]